MPDRYAKRSRKIIIACGYAFYSAAGVAFIYLPSNVVQDEGNTATILWWHVSLIIGGVFTFVGALLGRKVLEAAGLFPLGAALLAYAVLLLWPATTGVIDGPRLGVGLVMLGTFAVLVDRFMHVIGTIRIAIDIEKRSQQHD